jgi:hypothetical protein
MLGPKGVGAFYSPLYLTGRRPKTALGLSHALLWASSSSDSAVTRPSRICRRISVGPRGRSAHCTPTIPPHSAFSDSRSLAERSVLRNRLISSYNSAGDVSGQNTNDPNKSEEGPIPCRSGANVRSPRSCWLTLELAVILEEAALSPSQGLSIIQQVVI